MSWSSKITSTAADLAGKARENVSRLGKSAPQRLRARGGGSGNFPNRLKVA